MTNQTTQTNNIYIHANSQCKKQKTKKHIFFELIFHFPFHFLCLLFFYDDVHAFLRMFLFVFLHFCQVFVCVCLCVCVCFEFEKEKNLVMWQTKVKFGLFDGFFVCFVCLRIVFCHFCIFFSACFQSIVFQFVFAFSMQ